MRLSPQTVCHKSGSITIANVAPCAMGCGYSVTADCQATPPWKAARLFHRWPKVQTPRGKMARAEPRRSLINAPREAATFDSWEVAVLTRGYSYHHSGWKRPLLEPRAHRG